MVTKTGYKWLGLGVALVAIMAFISPPHQDDAQLPTSYGGSGQGAGGCGCGG